MRIICQEGATGLIDSVENGSLDLSVASVAGERSTYQCEVELLMKEQDYLVTLDQGIPFGRTVPIDQTLSMPLVLTPLPNARRNHLEDSASGWRTTACRGRGSHPVSTTQSRPARYRFGDPAIERRAPDGAA